jgi:hypothetical protein
MKTFAHALISLLLGVSMFAVTALGIGGLGMLLYWSSAINHDLQTYLPIVGFLGVLLPALAAIATFWVVFQRLHHGRRLTARAN